MSRMHLTPVRFRQACAFIADWHRHLDPPRGHVFSIGYADDAGVLHGVAIVGRPVARMFDDGCTAEVTRLATDGSFHTSMLYGAAWRAARALGYRRMITYTRADETGTSLRGTGWSVVAQRPARPGWSVPSRRRRDRGADGVQRTLWEVAS